MARPKGSKNKATLLKEYALRQAARYAEGYLATQLEDVLKVVVGKALEGDMQAAKLILDRSLPIRRAVDADQSGGREIIINIGVDHGLHSIRGETIDHATVPANGQECQSLESSHA